MWVSRLDNSVSQDISSTSKLRIASSFANWAFKAASAWEVRCHSGLESPMFTQVSDCQSWSHEMSWNVMNVKCSKGWPFRIFHVFEIPPDASCWLKLLPSSGLCGKKLSWIVSSWSACFHACGVPTWFGQHTGGVSVQNTLDISLKFGIIAHDVCLGASFSVWQRHWYAWRK